MEDFSAKDIFSQFKNNKDLDFDQSYVNKLVTTEQAYLTLQDQLMAIDKPYAMSIIENPMIQLLKSGVIWKKSEGRFSKW